MFMPRTKPLLGAAALLCALAAPAPAGAAAARVSYAPVTLPAGYVPNSLALSANGRFAAFAAQSGEHAQVFALDTTTRRVAMVSLSRTGLPGNADSHGAIALSADGRYVAFESAASNLVGADLNNATDVFVHDRARRRTERISLAVTGREIRAYYPNGVAGEQPSISADGRWVAFRSCGYLLDRPAPSNNPCGVAAYDRKTMRVVPLALDADGWPVEAASPRLDPSGKWAVFSTGVPLVAEDTEASRSDVYITATSAPRPRLLSTEAGDSGYAEPRIGRNVVVYVEQNAGTIDVIARDFAGRRLSSLAASGGHPVLRVAGGVALAPDGLAYYWHPAVGDVDDAGNVMVQGSPRAYVTRTATGATSRIEPVAVRSCARCTALPAFEVVAVADGGAFFVSTTAPLAASDADEDADVYRGTVR